MRMIHTLLLGVLAASASLADVKQYTPTAGGSAGVASFNGRTGPVTPQAGDYSASQINSGTLPAAQLPSTTAFAQQTCSGNCTATAGINICNAASGTVTITLPTASSMVSTNAAGSTMGTAVYVVKFDSSGNACNVVTSSGDSFLGTAIQNQITVQGLPARFYPISGLNLWMNL